MEQRGYPASPGTTEATQGPLKVSKSGPDYLMTVMPVMPPPLRLYVFLVRQRLPSIMVHYDRTPDTLLILIPTCNLIV